MFDRCVATKFQTMKLVVENPGGQYWGGGRYAVRVVNVKSIYIGVIIRVRIFNGLEVSMLQKLRKQKCMIQGFCRRSLKRASGFARYGIWNGGSSQFKGLVGRNVGAE